MTRTLQILFILTLGLILIFWIGDLTMGVPANVTDRAVTDGWIEDNSRYEDETFESRLLTLIYAIPTILLLLMTIKSLKQKNERLFYWTFLIGLTIYQIIPVVGLLSDNSQDPPFIKPILLTFFTVFLGGQILSVYRIVKTRKIAESK